jgi:GEVED domain/Right handed beta helix region/Dockerin type I domain/HYR domain
MVFLQRLLARHQRRSRFGKARRLSAESLERRHLLAVTFEFTYVEDNLIGFNDPTLGAAYRTALQNTANRVGNLIVNEATIQMTVESEVYTGTGIAGASSVPPTVAAGGGFVDPLIAHKIKGGDDFNGAVADGLLVVRFPIVTDPLQFELDPANIDETELDFGTVIFHELIHAIGWTSATTASGSDEGGAGIGTPGTWRPFDRFLSNSAGQRLIDGDSSSSTAFQMNTARWAVESIGGPGALIPGAAGNGLYFSGPIATSIYGGPVPLYSPSPFRSESSVVHLDSEGFENTDAPFTPFTHLMSHGIVTGEVPQALTLLEQAILADIGIQTFESIAPTLNLPGVNLFIEGNATNGFTGTGSGVAEFLASITIDDNLDPNPVFFIDLPSKLQLGINAIPVRGTDWSGNIRSEVVNIVVNDSTAPTITVTPSIVNFEATSASGVTVVSLPVDVTVNDIVDPNPTVTGGGTAFPIGDTTVTYTARDARQNQSTANVTVRVVDTTPPQWNTSVSTLAVNGDLISGTSLNNPALIAGLRNLVSDSVDAELDFEIRSSGVLVNSLNYGTHAVVVTAIDNSGNRADRSIGLTINDNRIRVTTGDDENDVDAANQTSDRSLREAIQIANDRPGADIIYFDPSVVTPIVLKPLLGTLSIRDSLQIHGIDSSTTVIDGDNSIAVIEATASAGDVLLDGVTIRNGRTTNEFGYGAGVRFNSAGELTVRRSVVTGNRTTGDGGAGAGIQSENGNVRIEQSTISNNQTSGLFAGGAGVWVGGDNLTITDSIVSGNVTNSGYGSGAGVYSINGEVLIQRSTIEDNRTIGGKASGAGVLGLQSDVQIVDSAIIGNRTEGATSPGGGVRIFRGDLVVRNSTVSGNSTLLSEAGGIQSDRSTTTISHSTITNNQANLAGGGIHVSETESTLNLASSVVAGNTAGTTAPDISMNAASVGSIRFSLVGNNSGSSLLQSRPPTPTNGNLIGDPTLAGVMDPLLGPLAGNGGPTKTHLPNVGSPLIDAGDPDFDGTVFLPALTTDQRGVGFAREINGRIDIGATERITGVSVTWSSPADIVYRTPLSPTQLNATANVPGNFVYSPPAGVLLQAGLNQTLSVTFTPTDTNLAPVTTTTTINVSRATPTIVWNPPAPITAGTALDGTQLSATADVSVAPVYNPLPGTVLPIGLNQELSVTFTPSDARNFNPATATVSIDVIGQRDYGDAPATYPVRLQDNGARHGNDSSVPNTVFLGSGHGVENNGVPSENASSDTNDDGVTFVTTLFANPVSPTLASARVVASTASRLNAWIDFNADGDWSDEGEQISFDASLVAGANDIPISVPVGASVGQTFARFRVSSQQGLAPTGQAIDGEVEDYAVTISSVADSPLEIRWNEHPLEISIIDGRLRVSQRLLSSTTDFVLSEILFDPSLRLIVNGSDVNQSIQLPIGFVGQIDELSIDGTTQRNTLVVTGTGQLDLVNDGDSFRNLRVIDLSDPSSQRLIVDPAGLQRLSPIAGTVEVTLAAGDRLDLRNADGWKITTDDRNNPTRKVASSSAGDLRIEATVNHVWQNFVQVGDVDNDGRPEPLDALLVMNEIRRRRLLTSTEGDLIAPSASGLTKMIYPDVDGDQKMTPLDALNVINIVRRRSGGGSGEAVFNEGSANFASSTTIAIPIAQIESINGNSLDTRDRVFAQWDESPPIDGRRF